MPRAIYQFCPFLQLNFTSTLCQHNRTSACTHTLRIPGTPEPCLDCYLRRTPSHTCYGARVRAPSRCSHWRGGSPPITLRPGCRLQRWRMSAPAHTGTRRVPDLSPHPGPPFSSATCACSSHLSAAAINYSIRPSHTLEAAGMYAGAQGAGQGTKSPRRAVTQLHCTYTNFRNHAHPNIVVHHPTRSHRTPSILTHIAINTSVHRNTSRLPCHGAR